MLAQVRLHSTPGNPVSVEAQQQAEWENGIVLVDHQIVRDAGGMPLQVTFEWSSRSIIHQDYTVFVQILDAENEIVAQIDRFPQDGQFPTSTWHRGDYVRDVYDFSEAELANWQRIIVGFYDISGQRLRLISESEPRDHMELLVRSGQ